MQPEPPEYLEFLAPYSQEVQLLARQLRVRMLELLPPCIETIWDATNVAGVAFGFTEKNADHFLHLAAYTKYVNLGFSRGAGLHDPESRLQGKGTRFRHIRMNSVEDLEAPYVQDLICQAHESAPRPSPLDPHPLPMPVEPRTIIRVMEGPKRRPKP